MFSRTDHKHALKFNHGSISKFVSINLNQNMDDIVIILGYPKRILSQKTTKGNSSRINKESGSYWFLVFYKTSKHAETFTIFESFFAR